MKRFVAGLLVGSSVMFVLPSGAEPKGGWKREVRELEERVDALEDRVFKQVEAPQP